MYLVYDGAELRVLLQRVALVADVLDLALELRDLALRVVDLRVELV